MNHNLWIYCRGSVWHNFYIDIFHTYAAREKLLLFGSAIFSSLSCLHKLASCLDPTKNAQPYI